VTTLVLDASAVVDVLLRNERGKAVTTHLAEADLETVAHLDAEVFSALARLQRAGDISAESVTARLRLLTSLDMERLPITGTLLHEAWALRENVMARDALYVALARRRHARLLTTDDRLARAVPDVAVELDRQDPSC
jgi:predicted nucleic acid-binding protein